MEITRTFKLRPLAAAIALIVGATSALAANDWDRDGLSDSYESSIGTDRYYVDTDRGGKGDGWEIANGFDPLDATDDDQIPDDLDSDNDGLGDHLEGDQPRDMYDKDTDGDGVPDTIELGLVDADRDGFLDDLTDINNNGMPDVAEALAVSGNYPDIDNDGIPDVLDADSDNDGLSDYWENQAPNLPDDFPFDPLDVDGDGIQNKLDPDADGDGKLDGQEFVYNGWLGTKIDTDGDGVTDHLDADDTAAYVPFDNDLDPTSDDMDHDGLSNVEEALLGTDPKRSDSDGGGALDGWEVQQGSDPINAADDASIPVDFDIDNDGVLNEFEGEVLKDADSDGDGLSDAIEIGLIDANNDGFLDDLSDVNNNGMPDVAEMLAVSSANPYPDFDGDGYHDHLDADADNDGVHDELEFDTSWVPEGYVGNPLDVDGDGMLNSVDLDSDGDGILDFEEQGISRYTKYDNVNHVDQYIAANAFGQITQFVDDDRDGLANLVDIDSNAGRGDSDGDGIFNQADVDNAYYCVWSYDTSKNGCQVENGVTLQQGNVDQDGDGIEFRYDLDVGNDGALDLTSDAGFYTDADQDGIPAIYDADDNTAYVPPEVLPEPEVVPEPGVITEPEVVPDPGVITEPEVVPDPEIDPATNEGTDTGSSNSGQSTDSDANTSSEEVAEPAAEQVAVIPVPTEAEEAMTTTDTDEAMPAPVTPETGAAVASDSSGGGAFSLWALLALCFTRVRLSNRT